MLAHLDTILNNIIRTDANKAGIIHLYYTFMMRADSLSQEVVDLFQKMPIRPNVFPISYQKYFDHCNYPLHIASMGTNDLDLVANKYNSLFK